jgi:hypothetical protein
MADRILVNAHAITLDPRTSFAQAVALKGERIEAVGSNQEILAMAEPGAEKRDLGGRTVIPGFNDNHLHALSMGDYYSRPRLGGLTCEQAVDTVKEHYRDAPPGELLIGLGWDYPVCENPHKRLLDTAFPENPVALVQFSGHAMWVNSNMLRRLKVSRRTPDPEGGKILREDTGEPSGLLLDNAALWVHNIRFREMNNRPEVRRRLLDKALALFREHGITSVQDNTWFPFTVGTFNRYRRRGDLTARIACWSYGPRRWSAWLMERRPFDGDWVHLGPEKHFIDGTFSTQTAWLEVPYHGDDDNYGLPMKSGDWLYKTVRSAARVRRQLAFHAIGDRATHELVEAVDRVRGDLPQVGDMRIRIEHGQLIRPADIPRIAEAGILVAAQPSALATPEKDEELLGPERARRAYPYRSLLDAGVHLSFGSDIPGEASFDPLLGIHHVVNRTSPERISPLEALRAYTVGSAYAEFAEDRKGTIEPGKYADLAVLSADPLSVPQETIKDIRVEETIVAGRTVYRSTG